MRPRRSSVAQSPFNQPYEGSYRAPYFNPLVSSTGPRRPKTAKSGGNSQSNDEEEDDNVDERAPLISSSARAKSIGGAIGYGPYSGDKSTTSKSRRDSSRSSSKSHKKTIFDKQSPSFPNPSSYNINDPPSMPGSPELSAANRNMSFGDVMTRDDFGPARASPRVMASDYAIDSGTEHDSMAGSPRQGGFQGRRHTIAMDPEGDVCFPIDGMSEIAEDDEEHDNGPSQDRDAYRRNGGRRRRGKWPDLAQLDDFSRAEKEGRSEERRVRKMVEPQLIGGRLRTIHKGWHRAEEEAPYRFTYFNEEFESTIHSPSISELVQSGGSFRELFIPDPPILEDSSSDEDEDEPLHTESSYLHRGLQGVNGESRVPTRQSSILQSSSIIDRPDSRLSGRPTVHTSGDATPSGQKSPSKDHDRQGNGEKQEKPKRFGERPTWWLDVLSPTDAEMRVIAKTFGIHPLTSEDIMMQEAREKVELFKNYYFVNYRSFEQDMNHEDFLEPVNMYVVVFREGIISFHFSMTPHPANVRRRIRQLQDYLVLTSDWISYAIIDDITDVFAPLIQNIEDEVDDIDDAILRMHSAEDEEEKKNQKDNEKKSTAGDGTSGESGGDMLRRVGNCRKKVMGLYRLLGNKADVIKGFAKRCNEHWEVAPRSEIGLYLGDIQDHIVTMTGNLSHYEK